jgi:hypothetical protein
LTGFDRAVTENPEGLVSNGCWPQVVVNRDPERYIFRLRSEIDGSRYSAAKVLHKAYERAKCSGTITISEDRYFESRTYKNYDKLIHVDLVVSDAAFSASVSGISFIGYIPIHVTGNGKITLDFFSETYHDSEWIFEEYAEFIRQNGCKICINDEDEPINIFDQFGLDDADYLNGSVQYQMMNLVLELIGSSMLSSNITVKHVESFDVFSNDDDD